MFLNYLFAFKVELICTTGNANNTSFFYCSEYLTQLRYTNKVGSTNQVVANTREPDAMEMFNTINNAIGVETYSLESLRLRTITVEGSVQQSQYTAIETALVSAWRTIPGLCILGFVRFLCCHALRESIHYSSGQTENVPKVVEDGDSPLQSQM